MFRLSHFSASARAVVAALFALAGAGLAQAQFTLSSPTTDWVVVQYPPNTTTDYFQDQQTGSGEADIVGGGLLPSFYTRFVSGGTPTTGTLCFRVRLGADDNPAGFKGACFLGVDANSDGKLDVFFGVNNSGTSNGLYIWAAGTGANVSPSTTSINSSAPLFSGGITASNYHWAPVTAVIDPAANTPALLNTDGRTGGDQTDHFLSFALPFNTIVSALQSAGVSGVTDSTAMRYVMGTANQANAFNQDLNGVQGGVNSSLTWEGLGAITTPITPYGVPANVAPVNTVPGAQSVARNATVVIGGISTFDVDGNLVTVQLSVTHGILAVDLSGGATISGGANASATLTLSGSQAQINAALATTSYTAPGNYSGPVTLTVLATDAASATDSDTVSITVLPNQSPVAVNDAASTPEETAVPVSVLANDSDPDGGTLSVTGASVTSGGGSVTVNPDNSLTYTPALNFNGAAVLSYSISDGQGGADSATVTITVTAVNDAPVAVNDSAATNEDVAAVVAVLDNDSDVDGDPLAITSATVTLGDGTATFAGGTSVTFTPAPNFHGLATVIYEISDGNGGTASAQITITVSSVNDAPVAVNDTATTAEDTPAVITVLGNDSDADDDALTVTSASMNPAQGSVLVNPNHTLAFSPAPNFHGTAVITYFISDGNGGTASATVTVTVTPVNDAPVAVNDAATTNEDAAVTVEVLSNDGDTEDDVLTVTSATVTSGEGTAQVNADQTVTFTPAANFQGPATVAYFISDGNGGTASAILTITVVSVNDAPVAVNDTATTAEDAPVVIPVLGNDTDADGDVLTVTSANVNPAQGGVLVNPNHTLAFAPAPNFHGTAVITYFISDGNGGTASATVTVTVTPVNDAPVAANDAATTNEDAAVTVAVLPNDSDVDGDALSVTSAEVTSGQGTVQVNLDKTVTFTPAANFHGPATVTYFISDGNGGVASAILTVTVVSVNDEPVATNDAVTTAEDTPVNIAVIANDSDPDGDALSVTSATVNPARGSIVVNADFTLAFTPAADFHGTAVISYFISDGNGGTASATATVTITPVNDAPVAVDDTTSTARSVAKTFAVLTNDFDVDGDALSVTGATVNPAIGSVTVNADQTLTFVPEISFTGAAVIAYTITDGQGGSDVGAATVNVLDGNQPPVAVADSGSTNEDTAVTVNVLGNDSDPEGDALSVANASVLPAQGTVVVNVNGTLTFTPAPNFHGTAQVGYTLQDAFGGTDTGALTITVISVNDAPVANADIASTPEDTAKVIAVLDNDSDVDGDTLSITAASVTSGQGTVGINPNGTLTFTPAANYHGAATILYSISDENGGADSATVTITITPVNDAPVAANDSTTTNEDTAVNVAVLANDSDADGDTLTVTIATVTSGQGAASIVGGATVTFAPALNFHGPAVVNYTISDGNGGSASAQVSITVLPLNDPPVAMNDVATTAEDTPATIAALENDSDVDGDTLTVTAADVAVSQGTVLVNADSTLRFTPALHFHGPAVITYSITDGNGGTASATVTVTVLPVNDAPVAVNDSATTNEDTAVNVPVLANDSDVDGDTLIVTGATVTSGQGIATVVDGKTVTFTPALNFHGPVVITYTISDGNGGTDDAQINLTVVSANDEPVALNDSATTPEDTVTTIAVLANDSDPDGDLLAVTSATVDPAIGVVLVNPDKTLAFTPAANFHGPAVITYFISDGNGGTASATVLITVTPVNDAPVAMDDTATTLEDAAVTVAVLTNDTDVDGDALTVLDATVLPQQGAVAVNGDQTITFTPALHFHGTGVVTYTISDGKGGTDSATVTITVAAVNDAPVANDDAATTQEDTMVTIPVLANDTDIDGDTLTVDGASVSATAGVVTINDEGLLVFTPALNFQGLATISYTIADGNGGTASAVAIVTVTPVNDAPVAANDAANTSEDVAVTIDVLANDSDADGDTLAVTQAAVAPVHGGVTRNPNGTITFTPAPNFHGVATITYTIDDGNGGTDSATVTVTVISANDAPVATNDTARTPQGRSVIIDVLANDTDPDGTPLSVTAAVLQSGAGVVQVLPDGTVEYTPSPDFIGTATAIYTAADPQGGTANAFIAITVDGLPVAMDDAAVTPVNTPVGVVVLANDADPEGLPLTVTSATVSALLGTVTIQPDGSLLFVPAQGVSGGVNVRYVIRDEGGNAASAVAVVSVGSGNPAPPLAVADAATTELTAPVTVFVLANDSDPNGGALTITSASVVPGAGTVMINPAGTLTFTAASGYVGTANVSYTITNPAGVTASAPVLIEVRAGNAPPFAGDDAATAATETPKVLFVLSNDTDPDGDALVITSADIDPLQGVVTINPDGTLTFISAPGFLGNAVITYSISDGQGGTATAIARVSVAEGVVNQPPVATNDAAFASVGVPQDIVVLANDYDLDGDALTIVDAIVTSGDGVVGINANGTLHFVPAAGFNDTATILYTLQDSAGATDTAVVTVNVNDNPVAVTDRETTAPGVPVVIPVLDNDTDPNGNPLSLIAASADPVEGSLVLNGDQTISFTPAAGFSGQAVIFYTISDGKGATAEGTALVMVNSLPVLAPDLATTEFGVPITLIVLPNDMDPDGDTLTVIGATVDPEQGMVVVNPDGTLTFTPASTFTGPAVITYIVEDSNGGTSFTTATIARANAGPNGEGRVVYTYCGTTLLVNPLRLVSDPDGDPLTVLSVSRPSKGTAVVTENGYIRYKPNRLFKGNVTDSFVVTLSDGNGGTTQTEITVRSFDVIAGTFQGLLEDASFGPAVAVQAVEPVASMPYRGRITATMNGRASFSARLEVDGRVIRFTGTLTGALQAQRKIKVGGKPATVTLTYHDLTDSWNVSVQGADLALHGAGSVLRAVKSSRTTTARFDVALLPQAFSPWAPTAGGATLALRRSGAASIVGRLPNGSAFSAGARLNAAGSLPLYRWLGSASAIGVPALGGAWQLTGASNGSIHGNLLWRQSAAAGGGVEWLEASGTVK